MQVPGTKENRATEISEISRSLKALAKELKVPVIALSQLNRGVEQRTDKKPVMSDLRESRRAGAGRDLIMLIYREEVYDPDTPRKGIADIIIAKQRNGPIGEVHLTFLGKYTRFENLATRRLRVRPASACTVGTRVDPRSARDRHRGAAPQPRARARSVAPGARVMAVIKANAYGHGLVLRARARSPRATALAVARLDEGLALRDGGPRGTGAAARGRVRARTQLDAGGARATRPHGAQLRAVRAARATRGGARGSRSGSRSIPA